MSKTTPEGTTRLVTAFFIVNADRLRLVHFLDPQESQPQALPFSDDLSVREMEAIWGGSGAARVEKTTPLKPLNAYLQRFECESAVFIPAFENGILKGALMLGTRDQQPISNEAIAASRQALQFETIVAAASAPAPLQLEESARRAREAKALDILSSNAAAVSDLRAFYSLIHNQIRNVIGNYSFVIALYDENTNSINVPYLYEEGHLSTLEAFPLGEGLTSLLIHTREPLMIVSDTARQVVAMGAKISGKPPRSWLGVPLLARGRAIGALIIQDMDKENSFNEADLHFAAETANQVANAIYTVTLLEESERMTLQFETAAEIARDVSSSLDINELLRKAVELIRARFNFYHASIFLKDSLGQFAIVREATGEAGASLKRSEYQVQVDSKSIVGSVVEKGEALIVNDTSRDPLFVSHPTLPETKAEAALALKVGDRILGALDVHSDQLYAFSQNNLRILQILADQLSVAVANSELFAETQERLAQHRLLHHVTATVASGATLDEALQAAVNGLQVTLSGDRVIILLLNSNTQALEVKAAAGYGEDIYQQVFPLGSGIAGWSALHARPLRIDDVQQDSRYIEGNTEVRSELAIPLLYRGEILGVLNVESEKIAAYTDNDEELLGTLGGSLAAVIANARLLEQVRSQVERERVIFEITDKIRRTTDIQTILATTASELMRALGASGTRIKLGTDANTATHSIGGGHE
ncbi:MAG: hypothetical protein HKUEN02_14180 [Anaerolineaceae bacterium]|nr:MAG: hypothetical protein HKUEN02_14180 [Anaerolineaceae bacterium]